jgi:hypothetical protein
MARRETISRGDGIFSGDHSDDCRRVLFRIPRFNLRPWGGRNLVFVLAAAIYALYLRRPSGVWSKVYVINALIALYLNFFVLVAQLFQKTPALKDFAPTQTEPPFAISRAIVLLLFIVLGIAAVRQFRVEPLKN